MLRENSLVVGMITSLFVGGSEERGAGSYETKEVGFQLKRLRDHTTASFVFQPSRQTPQANAETDKDD